jgi:hypothetical protein
MLRIGDGTITYQSKFILPGGTAACLTILSPNYEYDLFTYYS